MSEQLEPRIHISPTVEEEAVAFPVAGETVRGNLLLPREPKDAGVVFVHGWSGYRSGPHGIHTAMARRLAEEGYPSLRFDFRGRGESEGNGLESTLLTMAEDLRVASRFFSQQCGLRRLAYFGMCSGGNVAIGALPNLPLAHCLVLLSVYPFSDGDTFSRDVHRTWHYMNVYFHKALHGDTWRRLCRGDIHLRQVLDVLFGHFLNRGGNRAKEGEDRPAETGPEKPRTARAALTESRTRDGEAPQKHLANLRANCPALMVYGEADPDAPAALKYFGDYAAEHALPIEFVRIAGASHNFPSRRWKEEIGDLAVEFLHQTLA